MERVRTLAATWDSNTVVLVVGGPLILLVVVVLAYLLWKLHKKTGV